MLACEKSPDRIVLDCRHLVFIGSIGIREIARALTRINYIEIHSPSPAVRNVLEMIELGPRVTIVEQI